MNLERSKHLEEAQALFVRVCRVLGTPHCHPDLNGDHPRDRLPSHSARYKDPYRTWKPTQHAAAMSTAEYPPEILFTICAHVYSACLPAYPVSLDPLIAADHGIPTALPSAMPPGNWPEPVSRRTLASLCLVNHAWHAAAKPWLWRKLEVRLPRSWLSLVEEIAWDYDEGQVEVVVGDTIKAAALASRASISPPMDQESTSKLEENLLDSLTEPDSSVPLELLSPVVSRDPSPRRLRQKSKSPARWRIMRSISDAIQDYMDRRDAGVYGTHACSLMPNDETDFSFQYLFPMTLVQVVSFVILTSTISVP